MNSKTFHPQPVGQSPRRSRRRHCLHLSNPKLLARMAFPGSGCSSNQS